MEIVNRCGWKINLGGWVPGKRRIGGFTLIETLAAMAVFAIASLGMAMGVSTVIRANQRSFLSSVATTLAQDKLEELKAKSPENIDPCAIDCDSPVPTTKNVAFTRT